VLKQSVASAWLGGIALGTVLVSAAPARASCAHMDPQSVRFLVSVCEATNPDLDAGRPGSYAGLTLKVRPAGAATTPTGPTEAWVPTGSGLTCADLAAGTELEATLTYACCDGDPNPPCLAGFGATLSDVQLRKGAKADNEPTPEHEPDAAPVPAPLPAPPSVPLATPPPATPSSRGCGCTIVDASRSTSQHFWLSVTVAGLALVFARRRRGSRRAGSSR
jgi:MYXO-CTERM domain-containing protein